ncbi:parasitic phase-specific protein PSP-1 [Macroventuria anomochaeta]|uniref:Parasitic phase-specific protein PSP-1 n=1 Tax=Macroventuria anomochaeta TaxID=301207 RepID=A0ACB6RR63_9PLEO|nr:parasitic phase-specific protein PSP-1 [Macroventuria anomochaeta]KAF2624450.1 parasitic phase-specific protein PSP-1 [Macroventuria anomochaeta]
MAAQDVTLIAFGPSANCTLDLCPLEWSVFQYLPSIPANAIFISVFSLLLAVHLIQGVWYKAWTYMACMAIGCGLELVGYAGRVMLHENPFDFNAFLLNLIPITIAPVFFCAAIYVQLTQVINYTDRSISRFNPRFISFIFIPCDIISLVLQGTGGALSAGAETVSETDLGVDVSKAGLIFQVITLIVFIGLSADYFFALRRRHRRIGMKTERELRIVLGWLSAATILILIRCVFRIVELKDGYFAPAFRDEGTFIAFESVFMCIGVACMNIGHPARAFRTRLTTTETISPIELRRSK